MNWILVIVVVILIFLAIRGAYRGFLRIVFSLVALIIVIVIAAAAAPKISSFLTENTGIYDRIEERCVERVSSYMDSDEFEVNLGDALASYSGDTTDTDTDSGDASDTEESSSLLTGDWMLPSLVEDYLADAVISGDSDSSSSDTTEEESADDTADETMAAVTEQLSDMTAQAKEQAAEAIGARIASILLTIISYIIAVIAAIIVVKIIGAVIGLIGKLPVIGGINRLFGLFAGIFEGLLVSWVLLLLLSVVAGTESGSAVSAMIAENAFLTWLYDNNLVLSILGQFLSF